MGDDSEQLQDLDFDPSLLSSITTEIEAEFKKAPPTIAIIGLSGVGKSSTVNSLFGTKRDVSATTRGTMRFHKRVFEIESNRVYGASLKCSLKIIDAPGLGEDSKLDKNYLQRYKKHLKEADIALWVLAARNRAIALDQIYLQELSKSLPNIVIGINQADLVDPISWNESINLPSKEQKKNIDHIVADRCEKLGGVLSYPVNGVAYSATRMYNLQSLFNACLDEAPKPRRWMFEILKGFSAKDWLAQAKGLSKTQRLLLESQYLSADKQMQLGELEREA